MKNIHPTAIVSPQAKIGENVTIAPYAIIHDNVEIGNDTYIGPYAAVYDGARIGNNVKIYQSASVAHVPQDHKYANEETFFYIGDNTVIHEFVTLHRGTTSHYKSSIGKNCLLMAYSHVAHDCSLGDNVILANSVQIGGHVSVDDFAIIGGSTPVHQFSKIGKHCMIGGGFRVVKDVPPYVLAGNEPLKYNGINSIGLRRRGFANEDILMIKEAYNLLYNSSLNVTQAIEKMKTDLPSSPFINDITEFIAKSDRGIIGR